MKQINWRIFRSESYQDYLNNLRKNIPPKHLDPAINYRDPIHYHLSEEDALKLRLRYLKQELSYHTLRCDHLRHIANTAKYHQLSQMWIIDYQLSLVYPIIDSLSHKIASIKNRLDAPPSTLPQFNLEQIKQYPITDIVEVNSRNFFKLRDERTPSCKYYPDSNTWYDFGSCAGGDVIDLVMILNNCSFVEACKYLS